MTYLGDIRTSKVLRFTFTTRRFSTGAPHQLAGTPAVSVYKDASTTQSTTGVTLTVDYDTVTGLNHVAIDTSADGTFYAAGSDFNVVITAGTVDSVSVVGETIATFSIENRSALMPTTDGRKLDVSAGGEAGVDWANVGSPTTVVGLSGTTVKTATDVETDTADIQSRLPAALVGGRIDANVGAISADATAADNLEAVLDGTGGVTLVASAFTLTTPITANMTQIAGSAVNVNAAQLGVNIINIAGNSGSSSALHRVYAGTVLAIADAGATTTSIPTSSLSPAASVADQFKGRYIVFDRDTATAALRGQAARITASTALGVLTVTALTTAPASGDSFVIHGPYDSGLSTHSAADVWTSGTRTLTAGTNIDGSTFTAIPWNASWDAEVQSEVDDALKASLAEGYRGTGATGSVRDLLYEVIAHMGESSISGTTKTLKKLDGATTAKVYTLDSATVPTSITETT